MRYCMALIGKTAIFDIELLPHKSGSIRFEFIRFLMSDSFNFFKQLNIVSVTYDKLVAMQAQI